MDDLYKIILAFIFGTGGGAVIQALLNRNRNKAEISKILNDTDTQSLTIRSELLHQWITSASDAEEKIGILRMEVVKEKTDKMFLERELQETKDDLKECRESMQKCKENGRCFEN